MVVPAYPLLAWALVPFTLLVAASRVVLGLHYPTDVAAGAAVGALARRGDPGSVLSALPFALTPAPPRAPDAADRGLHALLPTDVYFPRVNGVSTSIATFRAALAELGHRDHRRRSRLRAARRRGSRGCCASAGGASRSIRRTAGCAARRLLAAARGAGGFDLVHVQTPFSAHRAGVALARERGLPLVETWHTHFERYFEHYAPWLPAVRGARASRARSLAGRGGRSTC